MASREHRRERISALLALPQETGDAQGAALGVFPSAHAAHGRRGQGASDLLAGCQALSQQSYGSRGAAAVIVSLSDLPPEHPLRNRPLFEIGASYQQEQSALGGK
jgi:hypothetical protein